MAVWGGLTNSCEKKRSEKQREKERYKHVNAEFQRIASDKKAFLSDQCKEIEENNRMGKIIFFKFNFIFKLYIIILVLPNIKMNPPQVYMCSPS